MANPNVNVAGAVVKLHGHALLLNTATEENVIGNAASSGAIMRVEIWANNVDGVNDASISCDRYDQDGTPIHDKDGVNGATTTGSDVVAGTGIQIMQTIVVPADSRVYLGTFNIKEDQSLAFTASAANDISLELDWSTISQT
jgi:hypothetical protein